MCASDSQNQIEDQDQQTMAEYNQNFATQYADQKETLAKITSVLDPILNKGPNQQGFSDDERNELNGQVVAGTAANYKQAAAAVGDQEAAEGGGDNPLPTGAQNQAKDEVAESAAKEESQQESEVVSADYNQGFKEFENAEEGEFGVASAENPLGYAGAATNQDTAAGNEANSIASEDSSWENALLGAAGSVGEGWATGGFKH